MLKYILPDFIFKWCCIIASIRLVFGIFLFFAGSIMGLYMILTAVGIVLVSDKVTKWLARLKAHESFQEARKNTE